MEFTSESNLSTPPHLAIRTTRSPPSNIGRLFTNRANKIAQEQSKGRSKRRLNFDSEKVIEMPNFKEPETPVSSPETPAETPLIGPHPFDVFFSADEKSIISTLSNAGALDQQDKHNINLWHYGDFRFDIWGSIKQEESEDDEKFLERKFRFWRFICGHSTFPLIKMLHFVSQAWNVHQTTKKEFNEEPMFFIKTLKEIQIEWNSELWGSPYTIDYTMRIESIMNFQNFYDASRLVYLTMLSSVNTERMNVTFLLEKFNGSMPRRDC